MSFQKINLKKTNSSADNVAFVNPDYAIYNYVKMNFIAYRNRFLSDPHILDNLHNIVSTLNIRERNRAPAFATDDARFRDFVNFKFGANPLLDVEVSTMNADLLRVLRHNQILKSDLMDHTIWAHSLQKFPLGATQITKTGTIYTITEEMTDEERILFNRNRNLKLEARSISQQYVDGFYTIPDHSQIKSLQRLYDASKLKSDPNHPSKSETDTLLKMTYSMATGVISHVKIAQRLKVLTENINSLEDIDVKYANIIEALNYIYRYNQDLATNLARLCLRPDLLIVNDGVKHWTVLSDQAINDYVSDNNFESIDIFLFERDTVISNSLSSKIMSTQEVSGLGVYLAPKIAKPSYLLSGSTHMKFLSRIMEASLHATIPGTFESNSIFMTYLRIQALFHSSRHTILTVQERDLIENTLRKIISAQGFSTFEENFESFKRLVFDKNIGENALWTTGDKKGYIWKRTASPFIALRNQYKAGDTSVMEWNFINQIEGANLFIGALAGDLRIFYNQLGLRGLESVMIGDSGSELYRQIQLQYYKDGDGNFVRIFPGELILDENNVPIGTPRFLSVKNRFVIGLSQDTYEVDTVVHCNDKHLDGSLFVDHGRTFVHGHHGMIERLRPGYSYTKIRKIKEAQDRSAFFISSIEGETVWAEFQEARYEIRNNPAHPFYDPHFETILLMDVVFDKLIHIYNNPENYHMGLEDIINILTEKVYSENEWSDYYDLTFEDCVQIANAFGKFVDCNGIVQIGEDWAPLWNNFRDSSRFETRNFYWYSEQLRILRSRIKPIRDFYAQFDPDYYPPWVRPGTMEYYIWNGDYDHFFFPNQ